MKYTQTPINSSIGPQLTNKLTSSEGSSRGLTSNFTPLLRKSPTKPRSRKVAVDRMRLSSLVTAKISVPPPPSCNTTDLMRFAATSSKNSEYPITVPDDTPRSNCLNTVNSTSAITSQTATFENH